MIECVEIAETAFSTDNLSVNFNCRDKFESLCTHEIWIVLHCGFQIHEFKIERYYLYETLLCASGAGKGCVSEFVSLKQERF